MAQQILAAVTSARYKEALTVLRCLARGAACMFQVTMQSAIIILAILSRTVAAIVLIPVPVTSNAAVRIRGLGMLVPVPPAAGRAGRAA